MNDVAALFAEDGPVAVEDSGRVVSSVVVGIGTYGKRRSGVVLALLHLGTLLGTVCTGVRWSGEVSHRWFQKLPFNSDIWARFDSGDSTFRLAALLDNCWLRQVGVGSVRSVPGPSAEETAVMAVADWEISFGEIPWLGSM